MTEKYVSSLFSPHNGFDRAFLAAGQSRILTQVLTFDRRRWFAIDAREKISSSTANLDRKSAKSINHAKKKKRRYQFRWGAMDDGCRARSSQCPEALPDARSRSTLLKSILSVFHSMYRTTPCVTWHNTGVSTNDQGMNKLFIVSNCWQPLLARSCQEIGKDFRHWVY